MGLIRCEIPSSLVRGVLALRALVLIFCGSFFIMFCFLGMVREKRGGRVGQREDLLTVWLLMEALDNA